MDFTINTYRLLLQTLIKGNYNFLTLRDYVESLNHTITKNEHLIILRHDVDRLKFNSLYFAEIQHNIGIKGTYFFRIVPQSFDEKVIEKIASLGHEIGYHYEDIDLAYKELRMKNAKLKIKKETRNE